MGLIANIPISTMTSSLRQTHINSLGAIDMKTVISKITNTTAGLDTIPIRVGAGVVFAAHGAQKLFGWFGGYGLEGTAGWMTSIGLEPGLLLAGLAGSASSVEGAVSLSPNRPSALTTVASGSEGCTAW